jgi:hypothetical protein
MRVETQLSTTLAATIPAAMWVEFQTSSTLAAPVPMKMERDLAMQHR